MRYFSRFMKTFNNNKYTNKFTEMVYNIYNYTKPLLKDNDILKNYYSNITLEIKYDTNLDKYVRDNLKSISSRLSRNSKFVNSAITEPFSYS